MLTLKPKSQLSSRSHRWRRAGGAAEWPTERASFRPTSSSWRASCPLWPPTGAATRRQTPRRSPQPASVTSQRTSRRPSRRAAATAAQRQRPRPPFTATPQPASPMTHRHRTMPAVGQLQQRRRCCPMWRPMHRFCRPNLVSFFFFWLGARLNGRVCVCD